MALSRSVDPTLVGTTLPGGFRVLAPLGRGGMGVVYEGVHEPTRRRVAIKVLPARYARDPSLLERFRREAETTSKLGHPNVVGAIHFHDGPEPAVFYAMELLQGSPLHHVLRREGRLAPRRAVRLVAQLLDALEAAHQVGVVHRDLKPSNIFVVHDARKRERVKVLDFGLAKLLETSGPKLTATGAVIGTPSYLSPEQALGRPVDARSDVFAVGIVLFELLSGSLPFAARDAADLVRVIASTDALPLDKMAPQTEPRLAAIVKRALARRPEERWPSARAMRDALLEWLGDRDAGSGRARVFVALAIAGAALAVMLGLGVVALATRSSGAEGAAAPPPVAPASAPSAPLPSPAPSPLAAPAALGVETCDEYGRLACGCARADLRDELCASAHRTLSDIRATLAESAGPTTRAQIERSCASLAASIRTGCASP